VIAGSAREKEKERSGYRSDLQGVTYLEARKGGWVMKEDLKALLDAQDPFFNCARKEAFMKKMLKRNEHLYVS